jgi:hypothetical protein
MDRSSVWETCCHPIHWELQDLDERIFGGGVSLSVGALREEPGGGGVATLLGTPKGYAEKALEASISLYRGPSFFF